MSDLRYDPIFGQWAVIAEKRQSRPVEFQQFSQRRVGIDCPFCRGNESVTPPAIEEWSSNGPNPRTGGDWMIRILPNKFPALDESLKVVRAGAASSASHDNVDRELEQLYEQAGQSPDQILKEFSGFFDFAGYQEVIVLSPRHVVSLSGLNDEELSTSFAAFQTRVACHNNRDDIKHVCLFMNCRPLAGASIEHSHFQLIASPICTDQVRARVCRMQEPAEDNHESNWRSLLNWEARIGERVIVETDRFLVFCPFASRYSNLIRIAGKSDLPFTEIDAASRDELAQLCRCWIDGIERCLKDPAYNLIFHLPPTGESAAPWFVDLVPRFPQAAGFELGTDCWVNPVAPESAAEQFRRFAGTL